MSEQQEKRSALWQVAQEAQKRYVAAVAAFDTAMLDGSNRHSGVLDAAIQDQRAAFERYLEALDEFIAIDPCDPA